MIRSRVMLAESELARVRGVIVRLRDLAEARFHIEWGDTRDLLRARELCEKNRALRMGLVDALVIAAAERLGARAVATLDTRHFAAVKIRGAPQLYPRDL